MNVSRLFVPGLLLIFFSGLVTIGVSSCRHNDDISLLSEICFYPDVLSIFQTSCTVSGCHGASGEEGMNLTSYEDIMKEVTSGNAMKSKVYTVLSNVWSVESMMPPDRPISLQNRSTIKVWIEQGAKNNSCL